MDSHRPRRRRAEFLHTDFRPISPINRTDEPYIQGEAGIADATDLAVGPFEDDTRLGACDKPRRVLLHKSDPAEPPPRNKGSSSQEGSQ